MNNLRSGDILIRISDNTEWEFSDYARGFVTVLADTPGFTGGPGIDISTVMVRPVDQSKNLLSDSEFRGMPASGFKKKE